MIARTARLVKSLVVKAAHVLTVPLANMLLMIKKLAPIVRLESTLLQALLK
jgi:hypothetical protein